MIFYRIQKISRIFTNFCQQNKKQKVCNYSVNILYPLKKHSLFPIYIFPVYVWEYCYYLGQEEFFEDRWVFRKTAVFILSISLCNSYLFTAKIN